MATATAYRKQNTFELRLLSNNLLKHLMHIVNNEKHFDPKYSMLYQKMIDVTIGLCNDINVANHIQLRKTTTPYQFFARYKHQVNGVRVLTVIKSMMSQSQMYNRFPIKKAKYVYKLVDEIHNKMMAWKKANLQTFINNSIANGADTNYINSITYVCARIDAENVIDIDSLCEQIYFNGCN